MRPATRYAIWVSSALFAAWSALGALSRYATFHNRTFDLALYARQAWGLAHGDGWEPLVGAHFLGTHVALVLAPLGALGALLGTVPVLLFAQSLAFGLATLPLSQLGARRFGDAGALVAAFAWLLYPNVGHVATYEFHPGSLAVLPLALALDALDRDDGRGLLLASLGMLACRADLALVVALLGLMAVFGAPALRRSGRGVLGLGVGYLLLQALVLRHYWPAHGSLSLHFGPWGGSPFGIVSALFSDPERVVEHVAEPARLLYVSKVLFALSFLPLLGSRFVVFALPFFAINLISVFPTTTELYSHYLTLAVPSLVVAAIDGIHRVAQASSGRRHVGTLGLLGICAATLVASVQWGALPWSRGYARADFTRDDQSEQAARTLAVIPRDASVQAPDALLPHLAERPRLFRGPPPERGADYVVLDVSHRLRFAQGETLLRTREEPAVRSWLARSDYGLIHAEPSLLTLARGADFRAAIGPRYFPVQPGERRGIPLTSCLLLTSAWLRPDGVQLELYARGPCPNDLAIRLGSGPRPARVDLLFDGLLSPARLRPQHVSSFHPLTAAERSALLAQGLHVGALRSSGAPPEPGDPVSVRVPLVK